MNPSVGHEQSGRRPALVISPACYTGKVGLAILCPITSHVKGYPFQVTVPDGLPVQGVVLSDQAKSLYWKALGAQFLWKGVPPGQYRSRLAEVGEAGGAVAWAPNHGFYLTRFARSQAKRR